MIYLQLFSNIFGLRDKLEGNHFSLAWRQIEPTLALSGRRFHYTMLVVELRDRNQKKLALGPVSRRFRKLFGPEKLFVKLRPASSVKLVFSFVVNGITIKITAKFRASRRLRCDYTKRIMSPEMRPKSFEKQDFPYI